MSPLELRLIAGTQSPGDLLVTVQEKTFDYLQTSAAPEIRVSAYFDRAWPRVESNYAELYISDSLKFHVKSITAGSKTRKVTLPGEMHEGEQLVIVVTPVSPAL